MELNNVPAEVDQNTPLEKAMENVSATVTFEEGVTKVIPAKELLFLCHQRYGCFWYQEPHRHL